MDKIIISLALILSFAACGGNTTPVETKPSNNLSDNPDYQKGVALIAKNDCLTCHKVDEKLIGPAYRDVANKYAGLPDTIITHLANKVMKGGTGVWGDVPMAPHPNLSQEDAVSLVKYVLLMKK
jgi:cytochrome c